MRDRGTGASYGADEVVKDFKGLHRALVVAGGDELTRRLDHERHNLLKVVLTGGKRLCVVWPLSARDRQEGRVATGAYAARGGVGQLVELLEGPVHQGRGCARMLGW